MAMKEPKNLWRIGDTLLISLIFGLILHLAWKLETFKFIHQGPFDEQVAIRMSKLPIEVLSMANLARVQKPENFRLSNKYKSDPFIYQRAIEFLYPLREHESSGFLFAPIDEKLEFKCQLIGQDLRVALYEC